MTSEPFDDDLQQIRHALLVSDDPVHDNAECPEPESFWRAAQGEASPREIEELTEHVVNCSVCATAWSLAVELAPEVSSQNEPTHVRDPEPLEWVPPSRRRIPGYSRGMSALALAASLALAVGLSWLIWDPAPPSEPVRSVIDESALRSRIEGQRLPRDDCRLRWEGPPEATRYELRVTTDDLFERVIEAVVGPEAELLVPAERLAALPSGTLLVWRVRALGPDGELGSATFENPIED